VRFRLLPPAAAPLDVQDLWHGAQGLVRRRSATHVFESDLKRALGVEHVFGTSSGRAALTMILRALHAIAPQRRNVIVPAYTCFSVAAAVVKAGLNVVPCDIEPDTFDFDFDALAGLIARTQPLCVVSTHLFGFAADVGRARALCRARGVFVVDDAAQGFGIVTEQGALGTLGDVGFYSFGRGKSVTSVHGGAIVTGSPAIAQKLAEELEELPVPSLFTELMILMQALAISCLLRPAIYWLPASLPFLNLGQTVYSTRFPIERLSGVAAGLLRYWQARSQDANRARSIRAAALRARVGMSIDASTLPCIRLPLVCASAQERQRLYEESQRRGLGFGLMYPTTIAAIPELQASLEGQRFPNAERIAERLLTIPVHQFVSDEDRAGIEDMLGQVRLANGRG
jgi:perosamine synthetase